MIFRAGCFAFLFFLASVFSSPTTAQVSSSQSAGNAVAARSAGAQCKLHLDEGFNLQEELESLEAPRLENVLKVLTGFLYLQTYITDCDPGGTQLRDDDDRQPTPTTQQPKRKCITTPDSQTICYQIKSPSEIQIDYCDDQGNCKTVTIRKNEDGTMTISNPNATIRMECTLDSMGRTQCRVTSVSVTGGYLTKWLFDDLTAMIKSITTSTNPSNNTVKVCLKKGGDTICYTVTPTDIEMCVDKPDGSTECTEEGIDQDVRDLIDWLGGRSG